MMKLDSRRDHTHDFSQGVCRAVFFIHYKDKIMIYQPINITNFCLVVTFPITLQPKNCTIIPPYQLYSSHYNSKMHPGGKYRL